MDFIEEMKWWHWVIVSLAVGTALGYANTRVGEMPGHGHTMTTYMFEQCLMRAPLFDPRHPGVSTPWISGIKVYPPIRALVSGHPAETQVVLFNCLEDRGDGNLISEPFSMVTLIPYEPQPHNNFQGDYPGTTIYTAQDGDTLDSMVKSAYGVVTPEGRRAVVLANGQFRDAHGWRDLTPIPGRDYFIPWDPAQHHTITDFLDAVRKSGRPVAYYYAWWAASKYAMVVWIGGSFLVIGLVWPLLLTIMVRGGLGRATPEPKYDLSRFKGEPKTEPAAVVSPTTLTQEEQERLDEMARKLREDLRAERGSAPAETTPEAPAVVPLNAAPAVSAAPATSPTPQAPKDEKSFAGEFYPVARSAKKKDS